MNFSIAKEQIITGLQAVQSVVSTRTSLPVLSSVLMHAEDDKLQLTATDLDITISCTVEAKVETPGWTTVPVKRLFSICREMGAPELEFAVDDKHRCSIRAGSSFYKINGLSADEFPPITSFKEDRKASLPQATIRNMMKRTSFAISNDESRYVLNGIYISIKDHKLTMVATDGRRLALADEEVELTETSMGEFIIPAKTVSELNRLLADKGELDIRWSDKQASFMLKGEQAPTILIITKLIEGNYPNYSQVIPTETKERVPLAREEFMHALRRAEIMTSEKANSVRLTLTQNTLEITANSPDVGEGRETLPVNYKGADMAVAFNPKYLIDPLSTLDHDEVYLELIDELSPGVLKVNGPFLYVVMPMRLS